MADGSARIEGEAPEPGTGLMPRASIYQLEAHRNAAIAAYVKAWDAMEEATKAAALAAPSAHYFRFPEITPGESNVYGWRGERDMPVRDAYAAYVTKQVDRAVWSHLIASTAMDQLMDRTEREVFHRSLKDDPPPATAENCLATIERLMGDADMLWKRGIAKAFSSLDRRFRSHDGFKVGSRVVLSYGYDPKWGRWTRDVEATLYDIDKTFCRLDGKKVTERYAGVVGAIEAKRRELGIGWGNPVGFEVITPYFKVVVYKNTNVHLWFTRKDLVQRVNEILADYYGENLGVGPDEADIFHRPHQTPATSGPGGFGLFPSPAAVVREIASKAGLWDPSEWARGRDGDRLLTEEAAKGKRILEPSAGPGAIAERALKHPGARVTCVEIQGHLAAALAASGQYERVVHDDFLNRSPDELGLFDVIVMNPPFDAGRDVDHVTHALRFLAEGGVLVSVMGAGVEYREDRKTSDFRKEVERRGGKFFDLPEGSFRESGTNMNTVLCCIGRRHWS